MEPNKDLLAVRDMMNEEYGFGASALLEKICNLAAISQPCDICKIDGERILDVVIDMLMLKSMQLVDDVEELKEFFSKLPLTDKEGKELTVSIADIIAIYPMPHSGVTEEEMAEVDLEEGEEPSEHAKNMTTKEAIRHQYNCADDKETEYFLRRYLAS